jgi:hypothetical protein
MTVTFALVLVTQVSVIPPAAAGLDITAPLKVLAEQPLETLPAEGRTFRFLWLPPFPSMRLVAIRVQDLGKGPEIFCKAATWRPDGTGEVTASGHREMSAVEWDRLMEVRKQGFWTFTPQEYPQPVFDGSVYVLEAAVWGDRTRVVQHVPSPGPFRELCREMFLMSGLRTAPPEESLLRD